MPAAMRWPAKIKPGTRSAQVTTVMDLFPTLCAAAGVTPRNQLPLDGKNVWPAIASGKVEPREDLFFGTGSGSKFLYSVLHKEWKLVREISRQDKSATNYLFRIADDPEEKHDSGGEASGLGEGLSCADRQVVGDVSEGRHRGPQRRTRRQVRMPPKLGLRRQSDSECYPAGETTR